MESVESMTNWSAVHARMLVRTQIAQMLDRDRAYKFLEIE